MNPIKLTEIAMEWLNAKKLTTKYSTYIKYKNIVHQQIIPFFHEHEEINETNITNYFFLKQEQQYSNSVLLTIRYVFVSILKYAEKRYHYKQIDFSYIKVPKQKETASILTIEQQHNVTTYAFQHFNSTAIAIVLGLYAGLRIGEICALKWNDIDFEQHTLTVSKTVQRIEEKQENRNKTFLWISDPKTHSSIRTIPIPIFLCEYLQKYSKEKDMYVLSNKQSPLDPRTIQYSFKKVCEHFHFSHKFHSLRHTYATNCVEIGIDPKSLSEILGHSDVSITLNRYVHSSLEFKKEQINKIPSPNIS